MRERIAVKKKLIKSAAIASEKKWNSTVSVLQKQTNQIEIKRPV
jgi:hypothetical protein